MSPPSSSSPAALGRAIALAAVTAALVGCTTAPLSFINDRQVYYRAVLNRYPLNVVAVDGRYTALRPLTIAPGPHLLTLDAVPVAGFSQPVQKQYPITIAPCTRYYLAAQRQGPLLQDWEMVVEETWPVDGCDPAKELEKARAASTDGNASAASAGSAASSTIVTRAPDASRADEARR